MKQVHKYWEDVDKQLTKITNQSLINFHAKGATKEDIAKLSAKIGYELPEDFQDFLTRFNEYQSVTFFEYKSLSISDIYDNWRLLTNLKNQGEFEHLTPWYIKEKGTVKFKWWHKGWIPFAEDHNGNLLCIDLAPAKKGTKGQIFYWETVGGPGVPQAKSFGEYLKNYKKSLEKGKFSYDEVMGVLAQQRESVEV
ncbi:SMI1/KNR4 family protein [uncultured Microscilla sp.]|uniref:SMI1/KNR4 family protein n=1 Tax=uncultured Microscilla sp. TaxID=432653 RepID=UPI00261CA98D|nr:SMI1/KNR4 family protein [uncultured Microscilla sp.]